jgi:outer membrane receptor for Fe3+-dicitrate
MMEKGLAAHKGSWLVMYHPDEKGGIVNIETKFIPFYE